MATNFSAFDFTKPPEVKASAGTAAIAASATTSTPFVFASPSAPATNPAAAAASTKSPEAVPFAFSSPSFNFSSPASAGNAPIAFSMGEDPNKGSAGADNGEDGDEADEEATEEKHPSGRKTRGGNNPFGDDVAKRRSQQVAENKEEDLEEGEIEDEEDGEDEEDYEDEVEDEDDDGGDMDSDDEGDLPYPQHEKGPNNVACEQCGEYVPKTEIAQHEKLVCSETPLECPYGHLHCGSTAINRRLLRSHVARNVGDHIVWLMTELQEQKAQIQFLRESLEVEQSRRKAVEKALESVGAKVNYDARDSSSRRGGFPSSNYSASPVSSSARPPKSASKNSKQHQNNNDQFSISFDNKPLAQSENRWTPHSLPLGGPLMPNFPKSIAGTGNAASDEQTKLKIAAGLLPASALKSPLKPAAAAAAAPRVPGVDDLPALTKSLKSVLNKLTAANFDKLSKQVVEILKSVQTEAGLTALVVLLFDKAVVDSYFSNIYSMLCSSISADLPPMNGNPSLTFKRFLLNQCQKEFEGDSGEAKPAATTDASGAAAPVKELTPEEVSAKKAKAKQRMIGTIRFIGELYLKDLIMFQIMNFCVTQSVAHLNWSNPPVPLDPSLSAEAQEQEKSDQVEAFCKLLSTIGSKFDLNENGKRTLDEEIFPKITAASQDKSMPSRLRFMLKDLLDLRAKKWKGREAAAQSVANSEKVTTTVEMGLGNHGVPVTSGRGAVHTSDSGPSVQFVLNRHHGSAGSSLNSSVSSSPNIRPAKGGYIHHDSHAQNSFFLSANSGSGKKGKNHHGGGGGGGRGNRYEDEHDNRRGGGGNRGSQNNDKWVRGDLLDSNNNGGGNRNIKSGGGGSTGSAQKNSNNRRR